MGRLRFFRPEHAVILNVEEEHLDFYADMAAIDAVFKQLLDQTSGSVFYSADDVQATRLCAQRPRAISFGFSEHADYRGTDLELQDFASVFCVFRKGETTGRSVLERAGTA